LALAAGHAGRPMRNPPQGRTSGVGIRTRRGARTHWHRWCGAELDRGGTRQAGSPQGIGGPGPKSWGSKTAVVSSATYPRFFFFSPPASRSRGSLGKGPAQRPWRARLSSTSIGKIEALPTAFTRLAESPRSRRRAFLTGRFCGVARRARPGSGRQRDDENGPAWLALKVRKSRIAPGGLPIGGLRSVG